MSFLQSFPLLLVLSDWHFFFHDKGWIPPLARSSIKSQSHWISVSFLKYCNSWSVKRWQCKVYTVNIQCILSGGCLWCLLQDSLPNVVPESPLEQIVEFSIDLVDPGYRELLDDPDSPQYIDLAHHLQDQVGVLLPNSNPFLFLISILCLVVYCYQGSVSEHAL